MERPVKAWKAFRRDNKGFLRFLFHTYEGTSLVPLDEWIETKRPWVKDGTSKRKYRSGFHFLRTQRDIDRFQKLTKYKYEVREVLVMEIEPKPRTSVGSWLARRIKVPSHDD